MDCDDMIEEILKTTGQWVMDHYGDHIFFNERDIVCAVYCRIRETILERDFPFEVICEFAPCDSNRPFDLAVVDGESVAHIDQLVDRLVIEIKYEPDRRRIPQGAHPRTCWPEIERDIRKAKNYVTQNQSKKAVTILFDEDDYYNGREHADAKWRLWKCVGRSKRNINVLVGCFGFQRAISTL